VHAARSPTKNAAALIEFVRDAVSTFDGVLGQKSFVRQLPAGIAADSLLRDRRGLPEDLRAAHEL
jgi:hypothetical protein